LRYVFFLFNTFLQGSLFDISSDIKETIIYLLNERECSEMVWRKLGITDMALPNLLGLMLKHDEWEIRSDIIAQLVFHKQVLLPDVLTRVTIGKYATKLVRNNKCANFAQNLLNRL
jgi:hypothetical protein